MENVCKWIETVSTALVMTETLCRCIHAVNQLWT